MKIGMRTPSVKRSIKARTTGRITRSVKSTFNPAYGKKGMGYLNNPKKAVYNKVYNKTTVSSYDVADSILGSSTSSSGTSASPSGSAHPVKEYADWGQIPKYDLRQFKQWIVAYSLVGAVAWCMSIGFSIYTSDIPYYDFNFAHFFLYAMAVISTGLLIQKICYVFSVKKEVNQTRKIPLSLDTLINASDILCRHLNTAHKATMSLLTAEEPKQINFYYKKAKNAYLSAVNIENLFTFSERTPTELLKELESAKEAIDIVQELEAKKSQT